MPSEATVHCRGHHRATLTKRSPDHGYQLDAPGTLKELDRRLSNRIEVSLLWDERDNSVMVSVVDIRSGESFDVEASADNALEVFHHPYAHAARQGLRATCQPPAA